MAFKKSLGTLCGTVALFGVAPAAQAETKTTLDVSAGGRAATNPYLIAGSSTDSLAATVEANPTIETSDGKSTLRLDGSVRYDRYFRRYGDDLSGRAGLSFNQRFSELTELSAGAVFATSMGGSRDLFRTDLSSGRLGGSTVVTTPSVDPTADVTVTGARFRQYNYGANARLAAGVSTRGQLTLGGSVNIFDANNLLGQPFTQYIADGGYNHIISDRQQVGFQVSFSNIDYRQRIAGDGNVVTPSLTGTFKLSPTFSINGRAGASFSSIKQLNGTRARNTAFSAQVSLCKEFERSTFCLSGNRNVQATSLGGVSTVTTVAVSQAWRLSERDSLDLAANYGQTDQPAVSAAQFGANRTKLALASMVYSRRLSERLFLTVSPQYEKAWGQPIKRDANIAGMIGLRYRFGQ